MLDAHRHHDVLEAVVVRQREQRAGIGVGKAALDGLGGDVVEHVEQVGDVEADVERVALVVDFDFFLRFFLLGVGGEDLRGCRRPSTRRTPRNFSLVRIAARCSECSSMSR